MTKLETGIRCATL